MTFIMSRHSQRKRVSNVELQSDCWAASKTTKGVTSACSTVIAVSVSDDTTVTEAHILGEHCIMLIIHAGQLWGRSMQSDLSSVRELAEEVNSRERLKKTIEPMTDLPIPILKRLSATHRHIDKAFIQQVHFCCISSDYGLLLQHGNLTWSSSGDGVHLHAVLQCVTQA